MFGVAVGNIILGVPFTFDEAALRMVYQGHFYQLFTPFALLAGVLSVAMLAMHGAVLLAWRTEGVVASRARNWGRLCALLTAALFVAGGFWVAGGLNGHVITSAVDMQGPSDPMLKTVSVQAGAWMANYAKWPLMWIAPALGVAGALLALLLLTARAHMLAFLASALSIAGIILTAGFAVPVPDALVVEPARRADGLGCLVQPHDPVDHGDRGRDLPAHRDALHRLGVPRDARQGHARVGRRHPNSY